MHPVIVTGFYFIFLGYLEEDDHARPSTFFKLNKNFDLYIKNTQKGMQLPQLHNCIYSEVKERVEHGRVRGREKVIFDPSSKLLFFLFLTRVSKQRI